MASGAWRWSGVAITTRPISGSANSASASRTAFASGQSRVTASARDVTTLASRNPATAPISGAWKDAPASPYPINPTSIIRAP